MVLQVVLPNFGAQAGQAFAQLGQGIRNLIDPNFERRREFENAVFTNPELLQQFADMQRVEEREFERKLQIAGKSAGDATQRFTAVVPDPPNVLRSLGFNLKQTKELLGAVPPSPERELAKASAQARLTVLNKFTESGGLEFEAVKQLAEAGLGAELSVAQLDFVEDYVASVNALPPEERSRFSFATFQPKFLQDIQFRESLALEKEKISLEDRLARLKLITDAQELNLELGKFGVTLESEIGEANERLRDALEEGTDAEKKVALFQVNRLMGMRRSFFPQDPSVALTEVSRLFGRFGLDAQFLTPTQLPDDVRQRWEGAVERMFNLKLKNPELTVEEAIKQSPGLRSIMTEMGTLGLQEDFLQEMRKGAALATSNIPEGFTIPQAPGPQTRGLERGIAPISPFPDQGAEGGGDFVTRVTARIEELRRVRNFQAAQSLENRLGILNRGGPNLIDQRELVPTKPPEIFQPVTP